MDHSGKNAAADGVLRPKAERLSGAGGVHSNKSRRPVHLGRWRRERSRVGPVESCAVGRALIICEPRHNRPDQFQIRPSVTKRNVGGDVFASALGQLKRSVMGQDRAREIYRCPGFRAASTGVMRSENSKA